MATAALSPNSILASPIQVNPLVKNDLQTSVPQVSQDAQKALRAVQTDTVIISPQALKMASDNNPAGGVDTQAVADSRGSVAKVIEDAKDAQVLAKKSQMDTITISPRALQLVAEKNVTAD